MIDRKVFFDLARKAPFPNRLTAGQVAGMETTLKTGESLKLTLCARDGDTYFMQYGDSRGFYMDASRLADLLGRLEALG